VVPGDDRVGLFGGTLNAPQAKVPVISTTFDNGAKLAALGAATLRLAVDATVTRIKSFNILADTAGRPDRKVVVGAHLDSVGGGPGINDNGTGVGTILETAIQWKKTHEKATNKVRFAFWGGEEDGLIGSDYYVSQLSARELKDHAVNLNFDMVGSPNYVRYVYDGDGSSYGVAGPDGSGVVEKVFLDYFASQNLPAAPTAFDGRSDYSGFIQNGIPAGGLFTGAEALKTPEEAAVFGGTAGAPQDACYHAACDTLTNVNTTVLDQMADAAAHATLTFARTKSALSGTAAATGFADLRFKGPSRLK
jgi:Zn-dependent M28 family amino/carboxypeptidase